MYVFFQFVACELDAWGDRHFTCFIVSLTASAFTRGLS